MKNLIFRVDASPNIGTGHLMRCLALGQAWKGAGGKVILITSCQNESLLQRLRAEDFGIHLISNQYPDPSDWNHTKNIINNYSNTWVVLDGYHFNENYQKWIKDSGNNLLLIDDMAHLKHYYADIILNQNLHAEELNYDCEPNTKLLMGTKYVLLRREFMKWRGLKRKIPDVARKILITLGGTNPQNCLEEILFSIKEIDIPGIEVTVILGACNSNFEKIKDFITKIKISGRAVINVPNMPKKMSWADIAISSGGTTVWELAFMGVPTIIGIITPIEEFLVNGLKKHGLFYNMGWLNQLSVHQLAKDLTWLILDKGARSNMSSLGQHYVNGAGCDNVLNHLINSQRKSR